MQPVAKVQHGEGKGGEWVGWHCHTISQLRYREKNDALIFDFQIIVIDRLLSLISTSICQRLDSFYLKSSLFLPVHFGTSISISHLAIPRATSTVFLSVRDKFVARLLAVGSAPRIVSPISSSSGSSSSFVFCSGLLSC